MYIESFLNSVVLLCTFVLLFDNTLYLQLVHDYMKHIDDYSVQMSLLKGGFIPKKEGSSLKRGFHP